MKIASAIYSVVSIFYGKKPRVVKRNGMTFELDITEGIDLAVFLFGSFQSHITKSKKISIPKDAVILDVGANFGILSLMFAKMAPKGTVYAFEPTHYAIAKFRRNMELNQGLASQIKLINTFLSDHIESNARIRAFSSWKVNSEMKKNDNSGHNGLLKPTDNVGSTTLDNFCATEGLKRVDFIKMDTEGHEFEIFKGARETISKFRPQIIYEVGIYTMKEKGIDFSFFYNYFDELGYEQYHSAKGVKITLKNYKNYIPEKGTIDIVAVPKK
jgi:FkbM family methyltransferase